MDEQIKKEFSWKRYLVLVIRAEIITILLTFMIWFVTHDANDFSGLAVLPLWILNSLIIFISSVVEFIKYKKYKTNRYNVVINIIIAIIAIFFSIIISIGSYFLNLIIYCFLDL